jgi:peroxiredoxin
MIVVRDALNAAARHDAERLVGQEIPPVVLSGGWERSLDMCQLACQHPIVIYFYPGCSSSPEHGEEMALMDAAQHQAFRDHQTDLEARRYTAIGISSQSKEAQRQAALANRVTHTLLCDPRLEFARELALPTFTRHGTCWYQRLMLVVTSGRIKKTFFPVPNAPRSAAQVVAWLMMQAPSADSSQDAS